jgi:hypothetical protein
MGTYVGITALNRSSQVRVPTLVETPVALDSTVNADDGGSFTAGTNTFYWVVTALTAAGQTLKSNEVSESVNGPRNEVQSLALGGASAGTYRLTFDGQQTSALAFGANGAAIQAALVALSNVASGDIVVTGTGPFTLTFGGAYANTNVSAITVADSTTGGTGVVVSTTTAGRPGDSVDLTWDEDPGATSYRVWRGTSAGAENKYFTVTDAEFTDTGGAGTSGTLPTADTAGEVSKLVPGTVHIVNLDDVAVRRELGHHSAFGQYAVVAANSSTASAGTLPSNS